MSHDVGVWIDHKKAVIVSIAAGQVTTRTLASDVGAHPHYSGSREGGGEKKYEERHNQDLDRYYDDVISQLGEPDANRASLGLVSMSMRHAIYQFAPTLFKALGAKLPFSGNGSRRTLSDTFAVAGYGAWSSKAQKEN